MDTRDISGGGRRCDVSGTRASKNRRQKAAANVYAYIYPLVASCYDLIIIDRL